MPSGPTASTASVTWAKFLGFRDVDASLRACPAAGIGVEFMCSVRVRILVEAGVLAHVGFFYVDPRIYPNPGAHTLENRLTKLTLFSDHSDETFMGLSYGISLEGVWLSMGGTCQGFVPHRQPFRQHGD